jgi:hypothetical protein
MKKIIDLFKFIGVLSMNIVLLFVYALTGDISMLILLPPAVVVLILTTKNSSL